MKKLLLILLLGIFFLPTQKGHAQLPAALELVTISTSATEVKFKAVMKPQQTLTNIEAVSVAVTYDPALFTVDANSITQKFFQSKGFDDASDPLWNNNQTNPDVMLYSEYHPNFGSVPILKNAPPDLCVFTLYPKSAPGTASFGVWMNVSSGALTYYFEAGVPTQLNYSPVTDIQNLQYPVELTSFTAAQQGEGIALNWVTAKEINNHGFHIQRRSLHDAEDAWNNVGFVEGTGTTTSERHYLFVDISMPGDGTYQYRLKQQDFDGTVTYSPVAVVDYQLRPFEFALRQNYPNPVSLSEGNGTMIAYDVAENSNIRLTVTNMLGQQIATLVDGSRDAGAYSARWNPAGIAAGTYIVTLVAESALSGTAEVQHMQMQVIR